MKLKEFNDQHNHRTTEERRYKSPKDENVLQALEEFKDRKFGLMMHWGLYSQLGIIESWALPDKDRYWAWESLDAYQHMSVAEFRTMYWNLIKEFNPINLDPKKWAKMAKDAGFKYYILTTKHHDGFCMWDSKYTDFKITSPECPYSTNANADICKVLFDAFRDEGIKINAYFSKPDWHSPYFWAEGYGRANYRTRMTTYNPLIRRKLWKKFAEYTKNQMLELVSDYGKLECLWLDGGQVCKAHGMDIKLNEIMKQARAIQPSLMVADRTISGAHENFLTPEQSVPDHVIHAPWESCLTLGTTFSYRENDIYKYARTVIHLLANIVAKGGNLALNIAPDKLGDFPQQVLDTLNEIGQWLDKNGYAIYETRPVAPYSDGNIVYTSKGNATYAIYLAKENECIGDNVILKYRGTASKVLLDNKETDFVQNGRDIVVPMCNTKNPIAYVFTIL